ncbi:MAG TPA: cytochrome P450 [Pseudonocardia sp.]|jgi:cholest-4-en-3-one 26-monooxygenase
MQAEQPVATRGPRLEPDPFYTSSPFEPRLDPPTSLDEIDLTDGRLLQFGDPHAAWRLLREQAPVYWHAKPAPGTRGKGFWAVTSAAGVSEVHRRADLYSLSESIFIDLLPDNLPHQLTSMDPPEHTQHRKAINRYFTAAAVQRWAEDIRAITNTVLDRAAQAEGPINFHEAIAAPVPFLATCGLLEMPPESAQELAGALTSLSYDSIDDFDVFTDTLIAFFEDLTKDFRAREDGLISSLFNAEIDGRPIDRAAALAQLWILFVGAIDTTAHATSIGLLSLFHHPEQFARLRDDLSLMPSAITELLRWTTSSNVNKHIVLRDTELLGVPLKRGDYVADYLGAANRDPEAFHDPYRFDITRGRESPIFTFGGGPHLCIGAQFARLEMKVIFEELLRRFPNIEQAGQAERGEAFTMILSPLAELPVRLGEPARPTDT